MEAIDSGGSQDSIKEETMRLAIHKTLIEAFQSHHHEPDMQDDGPIQFGRPFAEEEEDERFEVKKLLP